MDNFLNEYENKEVALEISEAAQCIIREKYNISLYDTVK